MQPAFKGACHIYQCFWLRRGAGPDLIFARAQRPNAVEPAFQCTSRRRRHAWQRPLRDLRLRPTVLAELQARLRQLPVDREELRRPLNAVMDYRELTPDPRLQAYVRCYWTLRAPPVAGAAPQRVLPDGCVEMIINVGASFTRHSSDGRTETQPSALLVGPTTRHMSIAPTGLIRLVGIRFAPGGALPFLSVSPADIRDAAPALEDVSPPFEPHLAERLAEAAVGTEGAILDRALTQQLGRARRLTDRRVRASVRAAFGSERPLGVDALLDLSGLGARQLERQFRENVGYGPKTLVRLARFQRVVRAVEPSASVGWARLAAENGYADQSHMSREFREFAGTTLTQYVRELHPMSDRFHAVADDKRPEADESDDRPALELRALR